MRRFCFYMSEGLAGGFLYCLLEILFRGYTHVSMFILGGLCFVGIGLVRRRYADGPLAKKLLLSGGTVTLLELVCGMIVNVALGLSVWDYTDMPLNLFGQVCVPYTALWCLLSVPAMGADLLFFRSWYGRGSDTCGVGVKYFPLSGKSEV